MCSIRQEYTRNLNLRINRLIGWSTAHQHRKVSLCQLWGCKPAPELRMANYRNNAQKPYVTQLQRNQISKPQYNVIAVQPQISAIHLRLTRDSVLVAAPVSTAWCHFDLDGQLAIIQSRDTNR